MQSKGLQQIRTLQVTELNEELKDSIIQPSNNIILNHDFSGGLHLWHPNSCDALVVSSECSYPETLSTKLTGRFAVITNRKEHWQGIEQDITERVFGGYTYNVCAWVGISGALQSVADVSGTLKLEHQDSSVSYLFIGRASASTERWEKLEGTFMLSTVPRRVVFYVGEPSPCIDLLIRSVVVSCASSIQFEGEFTKFAYEVDAIVRIFGNNISTTNVRATLWVQAADLRDQYVGIARVVVYFEGPPPGTDVLLNNLVVRHAAKAPSPSPPLIENPTFGVNIIANSNLNDGTTNGWFPLGIIVLEKGPDAGVDLMVAGLQIFPVDREEIFRHLKKQTDKVRKCDVVLKFTASDSGTLAGTFVKIR
ncbi:hypothetical protein RD792_017065 [Penstemon davidsonii]|uniref:CBM-cenC domain-containing protein n=1 Tax=Penstemon davidsonii TaxID=160366 RepID=A0ABR0CNF7_9LAMI|nr:hypothetical protein RD792_017065 [Penstemon davidsonii]